MIALPSKNTLILGAGIIVGGIVATIVSSLIFVAYNNLVDNPAVARQAREGYVVLSEKTAIETKLKIEAQRRAAAERISAQHADALERAAAWNEAEKVRLEQENADYEARLEAAGRRCELDGADIEWMRKP